MLFLPLYIERKVEMKSNIIKGVSEKVRRAAWAKIKVRITKGRERERDERKRHQRCMILLKNSTLLSV